MQLNSLFQDGAVLQREIFIPVWGTTAPNCKIEAELNGSKSLSRSSNTGYFILRLPPQQAGGPYTLTVRNRGSSEAGAEGNPVLSDTFAPPLTGVTVTYNGTPWTEGQQYAYSETTGVFTTSDGALTVPAATFSRDETTGAVTVTPGQSVIVITGVIS